MCVCTSLFTKCDGDHRDLHVLTHSCPTRRSSDLLCFFPVTIGMVKGLRSPDPLQRDLLSTYSAGTGQVFWKLRWPSSMPFLFASLKVAIAISLVGAIVEIGRAHV